MSTTYLHRTEDKGIPMHKRIPLSLLKAAQPVRARYFDYPVYNRNYPLQLLYGKNEDRGAYLYHIRKSIPDTDSSIYHEVVWESNTPIVLWDDSLMVPLTIGFLNTISLNDGDEVAYLHIVVDDHTEIPQDHRYLSLMMKLQPLWSPDQNWFEFVTNMTVNTAKRVFEVLWGFGIDDDFPAHFNPFYTVNRPLYHHTVELHPAFTYQYVNYPNESYALESLVKFVVNRLYDSIPTHGEWGGSAHITIHKDYSIEVSMSRNDTVESDEYGSQVYAVDVTATFRRNKRWDQWYWDVEKDLKFNWFDEDMDDIIEDREYREECIWQELDGCFEGILTKKEEE